ncbi:MAG: TetR/AcrR family transcriptional regulator [Chrysiogenetes bacterium]|nr:TetR/AcrR family transcriptional regulator [Chrysiogenetes bacterium]
MPQVKTQARRDEILKAATKVFADKGYHETGIADIAAEMGSGHGTFYRYFKNKRDIFVHVIQEAADQITKGLMMEPPRLASTVAEYRDQVARWGDLFFELFASSMDRAKLLIQEAPAVDEEMRQMVLRLWELGGSLTEAYLVNGKKRGFLRENLDTNLTAKAINAMAMGGMLEVLYAEDPTAVKDRWRDAVVALVFDGISATDGNNP